MAAAPAAFPACHSSEHKCSPHQVMAVTANKLDGLAKRHGARDAPHPHAGTNAQSRLAQLLHDPPPRVPRAACYKDLQGVEKNRCGERSMQACVRCAGCAALLARSWQPCFTRTMVMPSAASACASCCPHGSCTPEVVSVASETMPSTDRRVVLACDRSSRGACELLRQFAWASRDAWPSCAAALLHSSRLCCLLWRRVWRRVWRSRLLRLGAAVPAGAPERVPLLRACMAAVCVCGYEQGTPGRTVCAVRAAAGGRETRLHTKRRTSGSTDLPARALTHTRLTFSSLGSHICSSYNACQWG
jgi:hypothetical protein